MASICGPERTRSFLIEKGILPTPDKAKETFWGLGENWWRQIIDGEHQKYGPLVFDKGLHGGDVEPGYLEGVKDGCRVFTDRIQEDLSLGLYRAVHRAACKHFNGQKTSTVCDASQIDQFRAESENSNSPVRMDRFQKVHLELTTLEEISAPLRAYSNLVFREQDAEMHTTIAEEKKQDIVQQAKAQKNWIVKEFDSSFQDTPEEEIYDILEEKQMYLRQELSSLANQASDRLNAVFATIAKRLCVEPFVKCTPTAERELHISYLSVHSIEMISLKLIEEFNKNLAAQQEQTCQKILAPIADLTLIKNDYQDSARKLIGRLFAELEWLHPWIDGQGRTDLITLQGLLCREGMHPCILEEPYFSSGSLPEQWDAYLQQGLKKYEEFCRN